MSEGVSHRQGRRQEAPHPLHPRVPHPVPSGMVRCCSRRLFAKREPLWIFTRPRPNPAAGREPVGWLVTAHLPRCRSLQRRPANRNPQRALSLGRGNTSSCPTPAIGPNWLGASSGKERPFTPMAAAYSMTSSARARIDGGTVRASAAAVLRLTTSSNRVGCSTGRSAGCVPRSTLTSWRASCR